MKVVLPILAVIYLISPIDLIPDVLLGAGQLDDLTVIALVVIVLGRLSKWAPASVVEQHLAHMGKRMRGHSRGDHASANVIDATYRVVDKQ
jgi:uncharacterized membrane protein YkvA (DUF1232 family)